MRGAGKKKPTVYQERCINCDKIFTSKSAYVNHEKSCNLEIQVKRKKSNFKTTNKN